MSEKRIMTINLRRAMETVPEYRRAAASVRFIAAFVKRHMKAVDVKIDTSVNEEVFKHGMKRPPVRLRVMCDKDDKSAVRVGLVKTETAEPAKK